MDLLYVSYQRRKMLRPYNTYAKSYQGRKMLRPYTDPKKNHSVLKLFTGFVSAALIN
jgi:hypothetical protein